MVALRWMFLAAFGCMFFNTLAGAILVVITTLTLFAGSRPARCGHCGANLHRPQADYCRTCGASLTFTA
jgi:predicted amidophosphoribosyltransferase